MKGSAVSVPSGDSVTLIERPDSDEIVPVLEEVLDDDDALSVFQVLGQKGYLIVRRADLRVLEMRESERSKDLDASKVGGVEVGSLPTRIAVDANGFYWRDFGEFWSMCPVNPDNSAVPEPVIYYWPESLLREAITILRMVRAAEPEGEPLVNQAWRDRIDSWLGRIAASATKPEASPSPENQDLGDEQSSSSAGNSTEGDDDEPERNDDIATRRAGVSASERDREVGIDPCADPHAPGDDGLPRDRKVACSGLGDSQDICGQAMEP